MNRAKFRALVHYIIAKSDPSRLGAVRLNKILFYIDATAYRASGESITGETYVKQPLGPVPKHIRNVLGELEHANAIVVRNFSSLGRPIREYTYLTAADTSALEPSELALAEAVRAEICDFHTATSISELSHDQVWEAANIGETIPLAATLAAVPGEMTKDVYKWADSVVSRYEATERAA